VATAVAGIAFESVSSSYGGPPILEGVSFTAPAGEITVLVGPSGAGKTTFVSHVARLHPPAAGRVLLDGRSVWDMSRRELAELRRRTGEPRSPFDVPLWLAGLAQLVALTASALLLGARSSFEVAGIVVVWAIAAAVAARRRPR
jgi:ABC-type transport system involved in Fe-S cluster assembly fused permease/ATPase subunit